MIGMLTRMLVDCCVLVFSAPAAAINLSVCLRICDGLSVHLSAYLRLYYDMSVCLSVSRSVSGCKSLTVTVMVA